MHIRDHIRGGILHAASKIYLLEKKQFYTEKLLEYAEGSAEHQSISEYLQRIQNVLDKEKQDDLEWLYLAGKLNNVIKEIDPEPEL